MRLATTGSDIIFIATMCALAATCAECVFAPSSAHAISYVESSSGLSTPVLDGGRTEVEVADVNGDGNPDILSIGDHGNPGIGGTERGVMVWFGNGQGGWSPFQYGNFGYGGIAVGDLNGDGLADIGYGMHHNYSGVDLGNQLIEAALGDGTGRFWTPWDDGLATSGEDYGMFGTDLADVDNDGDLDIGSISFGCCAGVHVYLNHGDGTWSQSFGFTGGNSQEEIRFGDVDGDGNADLAVGHQMGTVYRGNGAGGFVHDDTGLPLSSSGLRSPDLGDADGDGADEVSFATAAGGVAVYRRNAAGTWEPYRTGLPGSGPFQATQLRDMDGDGFADVAGFGHGTVVVWTGNGAGVWTQAAAFSVPSSSSYQAFRAGGDVDHNGYPDIALVGDEGINHLRCFRENSPPPATLSARVVEPGGGEAWPQGAVRFIEWTAGVPSGTGSARVQLEYSWSGAGGPWTVIAADLPDNGRFQWRVNSPAPLSDARIRVRVATASDTVFATSRSFRVSFAPGTEVTSHARPGPSPLAVTPNPAAGGARISWRAAAGVFALSIHDIGGRRVFARSLDPAGGAPVFDWDGRDTAGQRLPSGVYFISVSGPAFEATRRLVIRR